MDFIEEITSLGVSVTYLSYIKDHIDKIEGWVGFLRNENVDVDSFVAILYNLRKEYEQMQQQIESKLYGESVGKGV